MAGTVHTHYAALPGMWFRRLTLCAAGEVITDENEEGEEKCEASSTKYQLIGVVVHSGQASGGHYYSYILHRSVNR